MPHRASIGVVLAALLLAPSLAAGQTAGDGFLFSPPSGSVTLRGGVDRALAGSDIFAFFTDELTLSRRDFGANTIAADVAVHVTRRLAGVVSVSFTRATSPSEFRHWEDNLDLPIEQTTSFARLPITGSLKVYLIPPGRSIGRLAWVPARYAVFMGAGGGVMWYDFQQHGDFIDFETRKVFRDLFKSSGVAPTAHVLAGVDVSLTQRFMFTTQARYERANARLSSDFSGFNPIDLSGVSVTTGISIRY